MIQSNEAVIFDSFRTPRGIGKAKGALHERKPIDLVVGLLDALKRRCPQLDPSIIDDIVLGVVTPIGEQGMDLAKIAAIGAGLPDTVGGVQLNRFCASGLEAVNQAAGRVRSGFENLILAGGVESMSHVTIASEGGAWANDPATSMATGFVPQGISADLLATIDGYGREDVDAYAAESNRRAAQAWKEGRFSRSIEPVFDQNGLTILDRDELIRPETTVETLSKLRPSFAKMGADVGFDEVALDRYHWLESIDHIHHPGNSSGIVDGAALTVIGSPKIGESLGLQPRARILAAAVSGADPTLMLTGPAPACRKALALSGLEASDIDLWEVNEAFAIVPMRVMDEFSIPHEKVNVNGGAIAMGHPLGATGAMLLGTALDELERREQRFALVTLCVGGGMGIATIIERIGDK
ncbi:MULTISPECIES: acetyl-CoA C-acetyltransferase [unclassified Brevibacterium]|uniref:acetyl-CoA C-acetyltransferase n=1 Tax=unclassified Brevibacterium TaxID=2614124 RepID=UPI001093298A|nr:acetyl-CoA C-acetyltransferase [Brevibacterium sp. S22]TGD32619.1 acetyl-CoA C-acetyltransferase [Brevibacterium sp. S22]